MNAAKDNLRNDTHMFAQKRRRDVAALELPQKKALEDKTNTAATRPFAKAMRQANVSKRC